MQAWTHFSAEKIFETWNRSIHAQFVPCKFCEGVGHLTPLNESKGELGNLKTT